MVMKTIKRVVPVIFFLTLAVSLYAAGKEDNKTSDILDRNGFGFSHAFSVDIALIETFDGQPSGAAHAFCLALTPEQIGFAIDTLEALAMDGMLTEGQANSLVSKLQIAQIKLSMENIIAVFKQLEDFINKINFHTKKGKLTPDNGMLLINSTLSVMCRT